MKVLLVHAHHEPKSFCSSMSQIAKSELESAGHQVVLSDLYSMNFDPVSDRRNFKTTKDGNYLKQQQEEIFATANEGFSDELDGEIKKLEECDALIFAFPLWWFGMPGILKGWCDRVLAMGRVYGSGKLYENGIGASKKRAMVLMTTGGGPGAYDGWGINPPMNHLLQPIQHGIFWFNGFLPLEPFIAWSPVRISEDERKAYLERLAGRMRMFFSEQPIKLPPMTDYHMMENDKKQKFVVVLTHSKSVDETYRQLIPQEIEYVNELKREGVVLDVEMTSLTSPNWKAFMRMRATDEDELRGYLERLPLRSYLNYDVTRIEPLPAPEVVRPPIKA